MMIKIVTRKMAWVVREKLVVAKTLAITRIRQIMMRTLVVVKGMGGER